MSTFVSLHPCLSFPPSLVALHTFTNSSLPPCLFLLLCICFHAFEPIHSSTPTCIPFPSSVCIPLTLQLIVSSSPPPPSCVLHRYCTFLHNICPLLFCFTVFFSLSLLGDPLVTSSLLQLPWFRGERDRNNCVDQTDRLAAVVFHTKKVEGLKTFKGITFYYRIQT